MTVRIIILPNDDPCGKLEVHDPQALVTLRSNIVDKRTNQHSSLSILAGLVGLFFGLCYMGIYLTATLLQHLTSQNL